MIVKWFSRSKCRQFEEELTFMALAPSGTAPEMAKDTSLQKAAAHLDTCSRCKARFSQLAAITNSLQQTPALFDNATPSPRLRRTWVSAIKTSQQAPNRKGRIAIISEWLWGPRLAWGSLSAIWLASLLLRFASPEPALPRTRASHASAEEVLVVFKAELLSHTQTRTFGSWLKFGDKPTPAVRPRNQSKAERSLFV